MTESVSNQSARLLQLDYALLSYQSSYLTARLSLYDSSHHLKSGSNSLQQYFYSYQ